MGGALSRGATVIAARLPLLAEVLDAVEAETPYGGRSITYEPVGLAWIRLGPTRRRGRSEAGVAAVVEALTAESRLDARLIPGRLLRFGGADWRIGSTESIGGRTVLNLERTR